MQSVQRIRRTVAVILLVGLGIYFVATNESFFEQKIEPSTPAQTPRPTPSTTSGQALDVLEQLAVKGRAAKTGYTREQFGGDWGRVEGLCDTRNVILKRDMTSVILNERCQVISGILNDAYTGKVIAFTRGEVSSQAVQIDHVVAISNAWQTGAQQLAFVERQALYNDPLELLAVDGEANNQKSDGDAATWLPPNKLFRCQYVARQIAVKKKYNLWVTQPERQAMQQVLGNCPGQMLPSGFAAIEL